MKNSAIKVDFDVNIKIVRYLKELEYCYSRQKSQVWQI